MFKTRTGVFETNSSSMHSIVVAKQDEGRVELSDAVKEDGRMVVDGFGRLVISSCDDLDFNASFAVMDTAYSKICYAVASYCYDGNEHDGLETVNRAVKAVFPEIIGGIIVPKDRDGEDYYGYVDHQSTHVLHTWLRDGGKLDDFIACRNVIVLLDRDESTEFAEIIKMGIVDRDSVYGIDQYCDAIDGRWDDDCLDDEDCIEDDCGYITNANEEYADDIMKADEKEED